jgi:hypothetical protein
MNARLAKLMSEATELVDEYKERAEEIVALAKSIHILMEVMKDKISELEGIQSDMNRFGFENQDTVETIRSFRILACIESEHRKVLEAIKDLPVGR